jgi:hypothetical protein
LKYYYSSFRNAVRRYSIEMDTASRKPEIPDSSPGNHPFFPMLSQGYYTGEK